MNSLLLNSAWQKAAAALWSTLFGTAVDDGALWFSFTISFDSSARNCLPRSISMTITAPQSLAMLNSERELAVEHREGLRGGDGHGDRPRQAVSRRRIKANREREPQRTVVNGGAKQS